MPTQKCLSVARRWWRCARSYRPLLVPTVLFFCHQKRDLFFYHQKRPLLLSPKET